MDTLQLAKEFSAMVVASHSPVELSDIIQKNRREPDLQVCHSHDYCDANMLMLAVFEDHGLDVEDEQNHVLWCEAWGIARKEEFFQKQ